MTFIKDHKLLTFYGVMACVLCLVGVFAEGRIAVYAVLGINFFMSIMFPTIFALGVKDLGPHTKLGSSFIIMAIVGGAILPPFMGLFKDIQLSFLLPAACFLSVVYYGWKGYRIKSASV
jgi:FHS family L-fucose permease-like MFS transporter